MYFTILIDEVFDYAKYLARRLFYASKIYYVMTEVLFKVQEDKKQRSFRTYLTQDWSF